jgi:hypothetical protein
VALPNKGFGAGLVEFVGADPPMPPKFEPPPDACTLPPKMLPICPPDGTPVWLKRPVLDDEPNIPPPLAGGADCC